MFLYIIISPKSTHTRFKLLELQQETNTQSSLFPLAFTLSSVLHVSLFPQKKKFVGRSVSYPSSHHFSIFTCLLVHINFHMFARAYLLLFANPTDFTSFHLASQPKQGQRNYIKFSLIYSVMFQRILLNTSIEEIWYQVLKRVDLFHYCKSKYVIQDFCIHEMLGFSIDRVLSQFLPFITFPCGTNGNKKFTLA